MIEQEHIRNVVVKVRRSGKQQNFSIDMQINESYQVDMTTFSAILKSLRAAQQNEMIFYFDHMRNHYVKINGQQPFVNYNSLAKQNLINVQVEKILSDEVLANPIVQEPTERRYKRSREKTIDEAFLLVEQWRKLYREGTFDEKGQLMKINLDQAAEILNTPRKTLQDYYLLFRKGHSSNFKFRENRGSKIGVLRSFIKERGRQKEQPKDKEQTKEKMDERKFFKLLSPELIDSNFMINENEIFDILEEQSSDQDILFQN